MSIQEQFNRQMARISEPIDVENDPFVNLFSKRGGRPNRSALVRKLRRAQIERMETGAKPQIGHDVVRGGRKQKRHQPDFRILWIPAGAFMIAGVFAAGFFGANLAGGGFKFADRTVTAPQAVRPVQQVRPERPVTTTLAPVASPPPKKIRQAAAARGGGEVLAPVSVPVKRSAGALLAQGHLREQSGDLLGARKYFQRAFEDGSLAAALAIGRSYDPRFVSKLTGSAQMADGGLARQWYEKWYLTGMEQGVISSRIRFDRLVHGLNAN